MIEINTNSYFALVMANELESKERILIKGELLTKDSELSAFPLSAIGTNSNDTFKWRTVYQVEDIKYNTLTTRQTVSFREEVREKVFSRDSRIIVWEGEEEIELPSKKYRIVTPHTFSILAKNAKVVDIAKEDVKKEETSNTQSCKKERKIKNKVIRTVKSNQEVGQYESDSGLRIKTKERSSKDIYAIQNCKKKVSQACKSWKERVRSPRQWMVANY